MIFLLRGDSAQRNVVGMEKDGSAEELELFEQVMVLEQGEMPGLLAHPFGVYCLARRIS